MIRSALLMIGACTTLGCCTPESAPRRPRARSRRRRRRWSPWARRRMRPRTGRPRRVRLAAPGRGSPGGRVPRMRRRGDGRWAGMPIGSPNPEAAARHPRQGPPALDAGDARPRALLARRDRRPGGQQPHARGGRVRARGQLAPDAVPAALAADRARSSPYTITAEDVAGPFVKIPEDMMEKAKLETLGYTSAAEALGEKFHASPKLLKRLNPGKDSRARARRSRCRTCTPRAARARRRRVVVDQSDSSVTRSTRRGNLIASYPATMGSEHDPLPIGDWKINGVEKDPPFHYNPDLFWDAKANHCQGEDRRRARTTRSGCVWIDLSKEHYGIHGTPEPAHHRQDGVARLHPPDQLGRDGAGGRWWLRAFPRSSRTEERGRTRSGRRSCWAWALVRAAPSLPWPAPTGSIPPRAKATPAAHASPWRPSDHPAVPARGPGACGNGRPRGAVRGTGFADAVLVPLPPVPAPTPPVAALSPVTPPTVAAPRRPCRPASAPAVRRPRPRPERTRRPAAAVPRPDDLRLRQAACARPAHARPVLRPAGPARQLRRAAGHAAARGDRPDGAAGHPGAWRWTTVS